MEKGLGRAGKVLKKRLESREDGLDQASQNCAEEHSLSLEMQKNRSFGNFRSSATSSRRVAAYPLIANSWNAAAKICCLRRNFPVRFRTGSLAADTGLILAFIVFITYLTDQSVNA